jgi:phosphoglycolate phosphatase-like HAD superfamily hydrolase
VSQELGILVSDEFIEKFWYEPDRAGLISAHLKMDPQAFWAVYRRLETQDFRRKYTEPYPDVGFLKELKKKGMQIGVVTGVPPYIAEVELGLLDGITFDSVVIANPVCGTECKPDPKCLETCLTEMRVQKYESVMVGNSAEDILTARNAGVLDILVERGEYPCNIKPTITVNSLYEIGDALHI